MTTDLQMLPSGDDEIDLREVFAALQRRWGWVLGGGLLGLALAAIAVLYKSTLAKTVQAGLIVDVAQGPCFSRIRKQGVVRESSVVGLICYGEIESVRVSLNRIAKTSSILTSIDRGISYSIEPLSFNTKNFKSRTQLYLEIIGPSYLAPDILDELTRIQKTVTLQTAERSRALGFKSFFGPDWIRVEKPSEPRERNGSLSRPLALGLIGGLTLGAGAALIADRRSNRVYSPAELLRRLNHPLRLSLPATPWTASAVEVLVGQLATQLDQNLSWKVLSIARQHEAVEPLSQLLQQQGGAGLQCESAAPLLSAILRLEPRDQPTGLLVVVEPGFNSARALEEACLLISQMSNVQAVGVVLIGALLPEELS